MKLTLLFFTCLVALCCAVPEAEVDRMLDEAMLEESTRSANHNLTRAAPHRYYKKRNHPLVQEHALRMVAFTNAARRLADKFDLPIEKAEQRLLERAALRKEVNQNFTCVTASFSGTCNANFPYRSYDGSCNNVNRPTQGMPFTPFIRGIASNYSDGVGSLRASNIKDERGVPLPLLPARWISLICTDDVNVPHATVTHEMVIFGQFLDHDFSSTPEFAPNQCCQNRNSPQCMPIEVPSADEFYGPLGISCIDAQRSIPTCSTGKREQMSQVTTYIDCSQIYGSSNTEMNALRNGMLLQTDGSANNFLPKDTTVQNCGIPANGVLCFRAGDDRVNENPGLTSMHHLFMREHNRIALGLRNFNPGWSNDLIWEESRRIVIAEFQQITYNEYLPMVLGTQGMSSNGITLPAPGSYSTYDANIICQIFNEFATAAYRFGHTLIQNAFRLSNGGSLLLENNFQNPSIIYQSAANIDRMLLGATQQPAQNYDNFVAQAVTNHLFQAVNANPPAGSDLVSLNIQRGRDHGLPSYNEFRVACGFSRLRDFDDFFAIFGKDKTDRFVDAYRNVDEIDLFPAGISEDPVAGGVVGPTFACIIGVQFNRLMFGDRFFFTHGGQVNTFRSTFLANIRRRTLGGIMCDNNANGVITSAPLNSFRLGDPLVPCGSHTKLNLGGWFTAGA